MGQNNLFALVIVRMGDQECQRKIWGKLFHKKLLKFDMGAIRLLRCASHVRFQTRLQRVHLRQIAYRQALLLPSYIGYYRMGFRMFRCHSCTSLMARMIVPDSASTSEHSRSSKIMFHTEIPRKASGNFVQMMV